jgi:hypothetical protein
MNNRLKQKTLGIDNDMALAACNLSPYLKMPPLPMALTDWLLTFPLVGLASRPHHLHPPSTACNETENPMLTTSTRMHQPSSDAEIAKLELNT